MPTPDINKYIIPGLRAEATVDGAYIHQPLKIKNLNTYQDLTGADPPSDPASAAMWFGIPEIPHIGQPHWRWDNFILESITAEPFDRASDQVKMMLNYRNIEYKKIKISSTVTRENTCLDADGKLLVINFAKDEPANSQVTTMGAGLRSYAEAPIYRPTLILEFDYITKNNPLSRDRPIFIGCVNSDVWQGKGQLTWLCTDDSAEAVYDPITKVANGTPEAVAFWHVHQSFHWRGLKAPGRNWYQTWEEIIVYRDQHNANFRPPNLDPGAGLEQGLTEGNGWRRVLLYHKAEFKKLNLPDVPALKSL